jgi:hypothetical protein
MGVFDSPQSSVVAGGAAAAIAVGAIFGASGVLRQALDVDLWPSVAGPIAAHLELPALRPPSEARRGAQVAGRAGAPSRDGGAGAAPASAPCRDCPAAPRPVPAEHGRRCGSSRRARPAAAAARLPPGERRSRPQSPGTSRASR